MHYSCHSRHPLWTNTSQKTRKDKSKTLCLLVTPLWKTKHALPKLKRKTKGNLKKNKLGPSNDNDAKWGCLGQFLLPKAARTHFFFFPFIFFQKKLIFLNIREWHIIKNYVDSSANVPTCSPLPLFSTLQLYVLQNLTCPFPFLQSKSQHLTVLVWVL